MNFKTIQKNKKYFDEELKQFIEERSKETISKSDTKDLKDDTDWIYAAALLLLYDKVVCDQQIYTDTIDKPKFYNDDILLNLFNRYKPFFSGNQRSFFIPENDIPCGTAQFMYLRIFNILAYELINNNVYAKTMVKQLYKVFYHELCINTANLTEVRLTDLDRFIRFISKPSYIDGSSNAKWMSEQFVIIWLYLTICDVEIIEDNEETWGVLVDLAHVLYADMLSEYKPQVPDFMDSAPSREKYISLIEDEDSRQNYTLHVLNTYDIDLERNNYALPLYHRMKRFCKRVFYWYGYNPDRDSVVISGTGDIINFLQAQLFLTWMFGGDESKITKELFQSAAAMMGLINVYVENLSHTTSNLETFVRIEDSAQVAKTYLEMLSEQTEPIIEELKAQVAKKNNQAEGLMRQIEQLKRENWQLTASLQAERDKVAVLQNTIKKNTVDQNDWQQLEELYASQVDEQAETIKFQNEQITKLNSDILRLQDDNGNLSELNKALTQDNIAYRKKSENAAGILSYGAEQPLFEDEIKETLLAVLDDYMATYTMKGSRREHILADLLMANPYRHTIKAKKDSLKQALKQDALKNVASSDFIKELEQIGFTCVSENAHIKVLYGNDPRYTVTVPKTASDNRSADNLYSTIKNLCF